MQHAHFLKGSPILPITGDESERPSGAARRGIEPPKSEPHAPEPAAETRPRYASGTGEFSSSARRSTTTGGTYGATAGQDKVSQPAPARAARSANNPNQDAAKPVKQDRRFRGAIIRTVASTVIPGLGMIGTRVNNLGLVILAALATGLIGGGIAVLRNPGLTAGTALQSNWMLAIGIGLAVGCVLWVTIILGTYLVSRPRNLSSSQRGLGAVAVGVLSLLISAPLAVAAAYSFETARISGNIFGSEDDSQSQTRPTLQKQDPWANKPRVNIALLGGDSGEGRETDLGIRTDTMMLASIDTKTGATLLIQLPRNLEHPIFPKGSALAQKYPYGFTDGSTSFLNAVWNDVPTEYPDLFRNTNYAGADALKWAFEGITDLKIDYFVMVNIDGLVNLIDAMGGVSVNVNYPVAKGGSEEYGCGQDGWISEGPNQHLNGFDAMWYARSRCNSPGSDFGRMQRQSCLVNAVIDQADPTTMATRYEAIAKAAGEMVSTDIPQEHLSAITELALRVQKSKVVNRLAFVDGQDGYFSGYPDFDLMKSRIATAIADTTKQEAAKTPAPPQTSVQQTATSQAPDPGNTEAPAETAPPVPEITGATTTASSSPADAQNITDACAYRHEEPAGNYAIPSTAFYTPPAREPTR